MVAMDFSLAFEKRGPIYDPDLTSTSAIEAALEPIVEAFFSTQTTYPITRLPGGRYWYPADITAAMRTYRPQGCTSAQVTVPDPDDGVEAEDELFVLAEALRELGRGAEVGDAEREGVADEVRVGLEVIELRRRGQLPVLV